MTWSSPFAACCQACIIYQLDYKPSAAAAAAAAAGVSSSGWTTIITQQQQLEVGKLAAGTKYVFRARGGFGQLADVQSVVATAEKQLANGQKKLHLPDIVWGDFSVESSYATQGEGHTCIALPMSCQGSGVCNSSPGIQAFSSLLS